jgi:hypothetical protein
MTLAEPSAVRTPTAAALLFETQPKGATDAEEI